MRTTWEEADEEAPPQRELLTYVLSLDDLCRVVTARFDLGARATLGLGGGEGSVAALTRGALELPDRWASAQHAELSRSGVGRMLRDLGSRNGTYVNGVRITEQRLHDGDLIEIGHCLLVYRTCDDDALAALDAAPRFGPTVTFQPRVAAIHRDLSRIAATDLPVLILGETGTGKDVMATALHQHSGRGGAYIVLDCGAIPDALLESTFFGHRRGAFTGAQDAHVGAIARADGGSLFFDEIGNLSPSAQAKLLRVLEEGAVTPLGGATQQRVDVRWIAATNSRTIRDANAFRPDLLRRLAGATAELLPLRQRREDLGVLSAHLLTESGHSKIGISASAARRLFADPLAGNIRQLRAALRGAASLAEGGRIEQRHLQPSLDPQPAESAVPNDKLDRARVEQALSRAKGNVVRAARALEVHPRQLYRLVDRMGLSLAKHRT